MDVFDFRNWIIREYEKFSRSFTQIRSEDLKKEVESAYSSGKYWPDPLIQINPNYKSGGSVDDLVNEGLLHPGCSEIFRHSKTEENPAGFLMNLHEHQAQAIRIARTCRPYVLTTGTGSGKSLSYFIPIIDHVLRQRKTENRNNGIHAIIVYPMNALCNSQMEELEKFMKLHVCSHHKVTFGRYTGQEKREEREKIQANPPDILLTNYVMLEYLMTRFDPYDISIRKAAEGLSFLVLDELHTYRGRQGADMAMLVRRVRNRFNPDLLCIGTSATMATDGNINHRNQIVAQVASLLFGQFVEPTDIVTEKICPVTEQNIAYDNNSLAQIFSGVSLVEAITKIPSTYLELARHPVACWIEHELGLELKEKCWARRIPRPLSQATKLLAECIGWNSTDAEQYLTAFLMKCFQAKNGTKNLFAFRLHQFISGAESVYVTLEPPGQRSITLEGQQFMPGQPNKRLFNTVFCRECGQEYLPIWAMKSQDAVVACEPRPLTDRSLHSNEDQNRVWGYLMPDPTNSWDPNYPDAYPEEWVNDASDKCDLKSHYRKIRPQAITLDLGGKVAPQGLKCWFIPGSFNFCLCEDCKENYTGLQKREPTKLSLLSSEGRSWATTVLTLKALKYLIADAGLPNASKKILAFSDNRQDASLQAGHFNDFIQVLLIRSALLAALKKNKSECLAGDVISEKVFNELHLLAEDYASNSSEKGFAAEDTLKALRDVIGYRLFYDLQFGWRLNNPNLEQLDLLEIEYKGLKEAANDEDEWKKHCPTLENQTPTQRLEVLKKLLDYMRQRLCIKTFYLDPNQQDSIRNRSFNRLKEPWGFSEKEQLERSRFFMPRQKQEDPSIVYAGDRSRFGRWLKKWLGKNGCILPDKKSQRNYELVTDGLLKILGIYGFVESREIKETPKEMGYLLNGDAFLWRLTNKTIKPSTNRFFRSLYEDEAAQLAAGNKCLHLIEGREHTAQVKEDVREEREIRFRAGLDKPHPDAGTNRGLPALFCSSTMELGVDISSLNAVYLRNVPPTPANYAQRSGRAGRSGQPALVITYCATRAPHDQYFFSDPVRMVGGSVKPPTIDLANEDLLRSHLSSVWLAETNTKLPANLAEIMDKNAEEYPLIEEFVNQLNDPTVSMRALSRATQIISAIKKDLGPSSPDWLCDTWVQQAIHSAYKRFNDAFSRWRSSFKTVMKEITTCETISRDHSAPQYKRNEADNRRQDAVKRKNLLLGEGSQNQIQNDFYTYRYLASEGFLPGYNFPRLPLYAFVPGRSERVVRDTYLSRPRFLGLTEFGPRSLVYHEGSTYMVHKAILTQHDATGQLNGDLPTFKMKMCSSCGYAHTEDQITADRCHNCEAPLEKGRTLSRLYRIDQVATRLKTRITADDENRSRIGYEMVTTLRFANNAQGIRAEAVDLKQNDDSILARVTYGPAASLWRINLGWRRRENKNVHGFYINIDTGKWAKENRDEEETDIDIPEIRGSRDVLISPCVEDTRNVLIFDPKCDLTREQLITLQNALKRGIEQEFQLEESELSAEPLPERENRKVILFYESAEGGAGVLRRLVNEQDSFSKVAKRALEICHYISASGDWDSVDDLLSPPDINCVAGCYRCLLSYYNQQEHTEIDRRDRNVLDVLIGIIHSIPVRASSGPGQGYNLEELKSKAASNFERTWLDWIANLKLNLPDTVGHSITGHRVVADFAYRNGPTLIFIDGPPHKYERIARIDEAKTRGLEDEGFTVLRFPTERNDWINIISKHPHIFGKPNGVSK